MNNKGVSEVIGVILMVAITVTIACVVYIFVSGNITTDNEYLQVSGNVTKIVEIYSNGDIDYNVTFDYVDSYLINDDDFDWMLGKHYTITLYTHDCFDGWFIYSYVLNIEELNNTTH